MEIIDPRVEAAVLPVGSKPLIFGKDQADTYQPLPSIITPAGKVITRWTLTDDEKRRLIEGEDLYLTIHTFNFPLQPVLLTVGPCPSHWND